MTGSRQRIQVSSVIPYSIDVEVADGPIKLPGTLTLPHELQGVVIFAHGSGSSRFSPRNQQVAKRLNRGAIATILFDLLTEEEAQERENVFDIGLLSRRLVLVANSIPQWLKSQGLEQDFPLGFFGASTGAGAALWAAAELGKKISAVVSRGGRPDLALRRLEDVIAPTLLIAGGNDVPVIEMNREALSHLKQGRLLIIPRASHLFEEPGTLESVAENATRWFLRYFSKV